MRYQYGKPVEATQIVVSHQHLVESLTSEYVANLVRPYVTAVLPEGWITENTVWHINPTGKFHIGGPDGDCGLTGRKIIVDTYGGAAPHGGGAFSGKDRPTPTKPSAARGRFRCRSACCSRFHPAGSSAFRCAGPNSGIGEASRKSSLFVFILLFLRACKTRGPNADFCGKVDGLWRLARTKLHGTAG